MSRCQYACAAARCSTPYGINGIFTKVNHCAVVSLSVLNALRHQWNLHPHLEVVQSQTLSVLNALRHQWNLHRIKAHRRSLVTGCSTPYGINGIFTAPDRRMWSEALSCSTPYGINGIFTFNLLPKA